jgi:hypothetical protein
VQQGRREHLRKAILGLKLVALRLEKHNFPVRKTRKRLADLKRECSVRFEMLASKVRRCKLEHMGQTLEHCISSNVLLTGH